MTLSQPLSTTDQPNAFRTYFTCSINLHKMFSSTNTMRTYSKRETETFIICAYRTNVLDVTMNSCLVDHKLERFVD